MTRAELIKAIVAEMAEWNNDALLRWAQVVRRYTLKQHSIEHLQLIYDQLDELSAKVEG